MVEWIERSGLEAMNYGARGVCFWPALLLALTGVSCARQARGPGAGPPTRSTVERQILVMGAPRSYRLYVPTGLPAGGSPPLVINFHGLGATAGQQETLSGMSELAEREGFIVAYPQGISNAWYAGGGPQSQADLEFVRALIEALSREYDVHPARVYATGISNGGGMANRVACDMAAEIAAIGTVAGAYSRWWDCAPAEPVALLAFHGLEDRVVPYEGSEHGRFVPAIPDWAANWAQLNRCGGGMSESNLGPGVRRMEWLDCEDSADIVLITIEDHGHSWPGSDALPRVTSDSVDATQMMWDFFRDHPDR